MTPRSRTARLALSAVLVVHLLLVADRVVGSYLPLSAAWTKATLTGQKWSLFANPRPKGWGLEVYGVGPDGERRLVMPSALHVEPEVQLLYSRRVKVQQNLAMKAGAGKRKHLAAWACREDPSLVSVELDVLGVKRPKMRDYSDADAPFELNVIKTVVFPCP